jgi:hypothetical protein
MTSGSKIKVLNFEEDFKKRALRTKTEHRQLQKQTGQILSPVYYTGLCIVPINSLPSVQLVLL